MIYVYRRKVPHKNNPNGRQYGIVEATGRSDAISWTRPTGAFQWRNLRLKFMSDEYEILRIQQSTEEYWQEDHLLDQLFHNYKQPIEVINLMKKG